MKNVFLPIVIALAALPQFVWGAAPRETQSSQEQIPHQQYISFEETVKYGPKEVSQKVVSTNHTLDIEWEILVQDVHNASCIGVNDGGAEVKISEPSGHYSIEWNTNPPQFGARAEGLNPGTYIVTVADEWGNVKQKSVTIMARRSMEAFVRIDSDISHPHARDGAATVVLTRPGIGPHTYVWHTPGSQRTSTATGLSKGLHMVTITDGEGCQVTESVTIVNRGQAVIPESPGAEYSNPLVAPKSNRTTDAHSRRGSPLPADFLNIYPNPGKGTFYLRTKFEEFIQVRVLDMQGRQMFVSQNLPASYNEINLEALPRGVYAIQVIHPLSGQHISRRLTIQ